MRATEFLVETFAASPPLPAMIIFFHRQLIGVCIGSALYHSFRLPEAEMLMLIERHFMSVPRVWLRYDGRICHVLSHGSHAE